MIYTKEIPVTDELIAEGIYHTGKVHVLRDGKDILRRGRHKNVVKKDGQWYIIHRKSRYKILMAHETYNGEKRILLQFKVEGI